YEQFQVLKKELWAVFAGIAAGSAACLLFIVGFAALLGFDRALTVSLLPKSVTTAIGVPLSELSGGLSSLTAAAIVLIGILGNVLSPYLHHHKY
ncbi:MAG: LrgB family protein, partial [Bacteroidaceae bacterium]|nr:LrgB family protein [Bacteroidaceae bacterium]